MKSSFLPNSVNFQIFIKNDFQPWYYIPLLAAIAKWVGTDIFWNKLTNNPPPPPPREGGYKSLKWKLGKRIIIRKIRGKEKVGISPPFRNHLLNFSSFFSSLFLLFSSIFDFRLKIYLPTPFYTFTDSVWDPGFVYTNPDPSAEKIPDPYYIRPNIFSKRSKTQLKVQVDHKVCHIWFE